MKDKLKSIKNKKIALIAVVLLVLFFLCVFISYNLNNATKLNSLLARVVQGEEPANSAFKDMNLYMAVIEEYNDEHKKLYPYTYSLSDEELASIEVLYAPDNNIEDASGIEKLTGLTSLYLNNNNLSSIDLSKNTKLTELVLSDNQLSNIDLRNNTELTYLDLSNNNLSSIDLSNNRELVTLESINNELSNLDISKNIELTYLSLDSNNLSSIDLSNNTKLTGLGIFGNKLSNVDISKNIELTSLDLSYNKLRSIDLSNNTKLIHYNIKDNNFYNFNNLKVGGIKKIDEVIKLPEGKNILYSIDDESVAKIEDDFLKVLKEGSFELTVTYEYLYYGAKTDTITRDLTVYGKLLSDKYVIFEDDKNIYVGSDDDNTILDNLSKEFANISVEENDLIIKDKDGNEIDRYKLIRVKSDKYDIDKDVIETDEFDINDISVINADVTYENGKLIISNKDKVIKEITVKTKTKEKEENEVTTAKENKENPESSIKDIESKNNINNNNNKLSSDTDNKNNKSTSNPSTIDNIINYIIILVIGLLIVFYGITYIKKKKIID